MTDRSVDPQGTDPRDIVTRSISVAELLAKNTGFVKKGESNTAEISRPIRTQRINRPTKRSVIPQKITPEETASQQSNQEQNTIIDASNQISGLTSSMPCEQKTDTPLSNAEQMNPDCVDEYELDQLETLSDHEERNLKVALADQSVSANEVTDSQQSVEPDSLQKDPNQDPHPTTETTDEPDVEDSVIPREDTYDHARSETKERSQWMEGLILVGQALCMLCVGGGLWIGFTDLWQWNSVVGLMLTVIVTLGLVAAVQLARRTVDSVSTLMAVGLGLFLTLGPLVLQSR